ncbi:unnamed protein product [Caenorhabditis angaria]|uniref:Peptidase S1 domain-containing protein n=1 Tax=Caenorhabditis angaria TaxID=860376 RepID=A0A9P1IDP6_9PELO|nr:unnamed protein product [Caenorhabditis angaria]
MLKMLIFLGFFIDFCTSDSVTINKFLNRPIVCAGNSSTFSQDDSTTIKCGVHANNSELAEARSWQEPSSFVMSDHRLIGGAETKPHAWPWAVQLLANGHHRCGGSLVDSNFVVTAAHCFARNRRPSSYSVRIGGHISGSGSAHRVTAISIHPFYNLGWPSSNDFAIMRIFPPVKMSATTRPICLPSGGPIENRLCVVTGWGSMREGSVAWAPKLREIHVPIIPTLFCNNLPSYAGRIHLPSMLCAGYSYGQIDSCQGDSGGPLMCARDGHWELTGIVSWGIGCGRPGHPGVYANVHSALTWIQIEMIRMSI